MAQYSITDRPCSGDMVRFRPGSGTRFLITVDTEEEFNWALPHSRTDFGLGHVNRLATFQAFCEDHGAIPLYLVDYPIANSRECADILRDAVSAGRAEIGIHLHPWVNPPYEENVCEYNTFAGNLPEALERAKFAALREAIETNFATTPICYRAGRYGVGPNTVGILKEFGIAVDTSARSRFDYGSTGGVNFRELPIRPWWIDKEHRLMEVPLTTAFSGPLRRQGSWLYPRMWRIPRLRGALARTGMLERIPLTPEGISAAEAIRGIDVALDDGLPLLVFSFHSPSLGPGNTPYVRNETDVDHFYDWWRQILAHLARHSVTATGMKGVMESVVLARDASPS